MREYFIAVLFFMSIFIAMFLLNAFGLFQLNYWGVKYQDARTNIFEETKAYKHGTIRDIENLCLELQKTESAAHKNALYFTMRHRLSAFDYNELPQHVKDCLN